MKGSRFADVVLLTVLAACFCTASSAIGQQPAAAVADSPDWWKHAVIYEIYPRSFQDSNGDGVGDLKGIIQRLDYLHSLGVDTIWLSPMFPSPQVDFGYDISNYEAIDPQYGTMADFAELIRQTRQRGMRVILDAVMNHTSDQHPWFLESKSSKDSPKRDWYIWRDGRNGGPPNNWTSGFGGSAWEYDAATKQYYYHAFYKEQPDLNWRNPEVVKAMQSMLRFWLDKGVAGFRLDAILVLFEDPTLADAKVLPGKTPYGDIRIERTQLNNLPEVHTVMRELRKLVDSYPGHPVLIGEDYLPKPEQLKAMYGPNHDELQLPMDMQLGFINELSVPKFARAISDAANELGGNQPVFVFDNHDKPRSWDRYGDGVHNTQIARMIAAVLLTTKATPLMYYGEELGMPTTPPTRREDVQALSESRAGRQ
jgi:alpha-glucosidase